MRRPRPRRRGSWGAVTTEKIYHWRAEQRRPRLLNRETPPKRERPHGVLPTTLTRMWEEPATREVVFLELLVFLASVVLVFGVIPLLEETR